MWKSAREKGMANDALIMSASDWASFMISCTVVPVHQVKTWKKISAKRGANVLVGSNAYGSLWTQREQFKRWAMHRGNERILFRKFVDLAYLCVNPIPFLAKSLPLSDRSHVLFECNDNDFFYTAFPKRPHHTVYVNSRKCTTRF